MFFSLQLKLVYFELLSVYYTEVLSRQNVFFQWYIRPENGKRLPYDMKALLVFRQTLPLVWCGIFKLLLSCGSSPTTKIFQGNNKRRVILLCLSWTCELSKKSRRLHVALFTAVNHRHESVLNPLTGGRSFAVDCSDGCPR